MPVVLNCSYGECDYVRSHDALSGTLGCIDRVNQQSVLGTKECVDRFVNMSDFAHYQEMTWVESPLKYFSTLTFTTDVY